MVDTLVLQEINTFQVGKEIGQCKWFDDQLGYGFVTVVSDGEYKGIDVFVHHTGVKPKNSTYRTLYKGEYVNLDIYTSDRGLHSATNITGILGGPLMCDMNPNIIRPKTSRSKKPRPVVKISN